MTTVSYRFESPARVMLFAGVSALAQGAMTADQASQPEGVDPQERRWQLEWDRRNVED